MDRLQQLSPMTLSLEWGQDQHLAYTWPGFVWVHVVIVNCHVANGRKERLSILIVLLKYEEEVPPLVVYVYEAGRLNEPHQEGLEAFMILPKSRAGHVGFVDLIGDIFSFLYTVDFVCMEQGAKGLEVGLLLQQ
uniref:Uncharacterized protein n=1 Tax=Anguilla anguilla TaxID=7936 RepID=A0A0E9XDB0_ANGAN